MKSILYHANQIDYAEREIQAIVDRTQDFNIERRINLKKELLEEHLCEVVTHKSKEQMLEKQRGIYLLILLDEIRAYELKTKNSLKKFYMRVRAVMGDEIFNQLDLVGYYKIYRQLKGIKTYKNGRVSKSRYELTQYATEIIFTVTDNCDIENDRKRYFKLKKQTSNSKIDNDFYGVLEVVTELKNKRQVQRKHTVGV